MLDYDKKVYIFIISIIFMFISCQSARVSDPGITALETSEHIGSLEAEQSASRETGTRLADRATEITGEISAAATRSGTLAATIRESDDYITELERILEEIRANPIETDPGESGANCSISAQD